MYLLTACILACIRDSDTSPFTWWIHVRIHHFLSEEPGFSTFYLVDLDPPKVTCWTKIRHIWPVDLIRHIWLEGSRSAKFDLVDLDPPYFTWWTRNYHISSSGSWSVKFHPVDPDPSLYTWWTRNRQILTVCPESFWYI